MSEYFDKEDITSSDEPNVSDESSQENQSDNTQLMEAENEEDSKPSNDDNNKVNEENLTKKTDNLDESEKIVLTKDQFDAKSAKIRAIAEKKARRQTERELLEKQAALLASSPPSAPSPPSAAPQLLQDPTGQYIFVPELGRWISNDMTVTELMQLANEINVNPPPTNGQNNQAIPSNITSENAQVNPTNQSVPSQKSVFTEAAEQQLIENEVEIPDFVSVLKQVSFITPDMVNAATVDPQGLKNIYQMAKDSPHELYRISQLSPIERQQAMWSLNQKAQNKRAKKVQTQATRQPAPLQTGSGKINKSWADMSYSEKKAARQREIWGS